ncbi:MFS transporter [Kribbella shirazensis]|uniref:Putative MFS family arabinose efflux permease n=1 Tax=Kribbella shirazensis TaxID=1105143 RepID=A0A7X5VC54_9ACTN|nr:putative MFS family arabinose efflux permease [Kribbella shirazensis]
MDGLRGTGDLVLRDTSPAATEQAGRLLRLALPGVALIAVTFGLARYGYGLLLPEMQSDLGISSHTAGLIASGAYASYLVTNIAVIWLTVHLGPRWPIGLAAGLAAAGMAVVATAQTPAGAAVGVVVAGAAAGFALPPYADIVDQEAPPSRRALAWSTISSGTGWGVAVAGPVAVGFGDSWRFAWLTFVVLTVAAGIIATALAPAKVRHEGRPRVPQLSWTWFVCPKSRPLLLSSVLIGAGSAVWWTFSVEALRTAGLSGGQARLAYAVCGVAAIIASWSGSVVDRIGLRNSYLTACALLAAALGLIALGASRFALVLLAAVLFGAFYSAVVASQGIWSASVFARRPSAGLAAVNTALTLGTITGPALGGTAIHAIGHTRTLLTAAAVVGVAVFFCPPSARRREVLAAHRCRATPVRD